MTPARTPVATYRYALAIVAVGAAAALTRELVHLGDPGLSPLFFAAVLISAWYGGFGPGLLATLLSGVASTWLSLRRGPISEILNPEQFLRLTVFLIVAVLTSSLHAALRSAAAALAVARDVAESADRAKTKFLAMVSHELRTPLSPVLIAVDLLEGDPALPEKLKPDVETIRRHLRLQMRIIDDLVDLSRISTGRMSLHNQPVDLHAVLREAMRVCAPSADEKSLIVTSEFSASATTVVGDDVRLQQVFWNLLRNAVKFTPRGGEVHVATANEDGAIRIDIRDAGIGIEPTKLPEIFEAFEQAGGEIQSTFGGMGLGLTICKALVDAHGGSVAAASEGVGKGATFTVLLPTAPAVAVRPEIVPPTAALARPVA